MEPKTGWAALAADLLVDSVLFPLMIVFTILFCLLSTEPRLPCQHLPRVVRAAAVQHILTKAIEQLPVSELSVAARRTALVLGCSVANRAANMFERAHRLVWPHVSKVLGNLPEHGPYSACAAPNISECIQCSKPLKYQPAKRTGETWFYRLGQPGLKGTEWQATCQSCDLLYDIEGYQKASLAGQRTSVKLMLPAENRHPDYIRVSGRTFIHKEFVDWYEVQLQTAQCSIEGLAASHNSMVLSSLGLACKEAQGETQ
jgi:hypothetical protein